MAVKALQRKKKESTRRGASTPQEWKALCRKALAAAEKVGDRRAAGIKVALEKGREQVVLRTMHIICENDITREFSPPKT